MKTYSIIAVILFLMATGCRSAKENVPETNEDESVFIEIQEEDTLEYELLIFDPGFEVWFDQTSKPITFYEQSYLESWNAQLVNQWNTFRGSTWQMRCMPVSHIDYRPAVDYGKELNYRLFYYFKYMHQKCRIFDTTPGEWR
ncbi:MAG: DUF6146 family protein [Bacteroidota bacterium]